MHFRKKKKTNHEKQEDSNLNFPPHAFTAVNFSYY